MLIERHKIDVSLAQEQFNAAVEGLPSFVAMARKPRFVVDLAEAAREIVINGWVVKPTSPEIHNALRLGAQAYGAFFAVASASAEKPVTVAIGDARVTYDTPPDESTLDVGRWLNAFYFAKLAGDTDALGHLLAVSGEALRKSSTKSPEYDYLYMDAIRAWCAGEQTIAEKIVAALRATDPHNNKVFDADWALYLVSFQLELLMSVLTHDANLNRVLAKAVESHRTYWSAKQDRRRNYKGYVSVPLTVLALEAKRRGLAIDVESPYLATGLAAR